MRRGSTIARHSRGSLDWVLERAESDAVHSRAASASPPTRRTPQETVAFSWPWAQLELGLDWSKSRALEVADRTPLALEFLAGKSPRDHLTLLTRPGHLERVASCFPEARFFCGGLRTLAKLAAGRFDWVAHLSIEDDQLVRELPWLAALLRPKGVLLRRCGPLSADNWVICRSLHERHRLRIVEHFPLADQSLLIVSRRR